MNWLLRLVAVALGLSGLIASIALGVANLTAPLYVILSLCGAVVAVSWLYAALIRPENFRSLMKPGSPQHAPRPDGRVLVAGFDARRLARWLYLLSLFPVLFSAVVPNGLGIGLLLGLLILVTGIALHLWWWWARHFRGK